MLGSYLFIPFRTTHPVQLIKALGVGWQHELSGGGEETDVGDTSFAGAPLVAFERLAEVWLEEIADDLGSVGAAQQDQFGAFGGRGVGVVNNNGAPGSERGFDELRLPAPPVFVQQIFADQFVRGGKM